MICCKTLSLVTLEYMSGKTLDLTPYGIRTVIDSRMKELETIGVEKLTPTKAAFGAVTIDGVCYTFQKKLGSGTFGTTYKSTAPDGTIVAVKWVKNVTSFLDLQMVLREVIIQILLAEVSRHEPNGPFVPEIYKVGYDSTLHTAFIVTEMMENTVHNLIDVLSPSTNNIIVPDMLSQIADGLAFFQKQLKFNHRDLKPDNIMFTRNASNKRIYKLIDFGFSCLKWGDLEIKAGLYYSQRNECFRKERDLAQLVYYILNYKYDYISVDLYNWLEKMLAVKINNRKCTAMGYCMVHGDRHLHNWQNSYSFYDNKSVKSRYMGPDAVLSKVKLFQERKDFHANKVLKPKLVLAAADPTAICAIGRVAEGGVCAPPVANPIECPPGYIRNPKTRRCVKLTGAAGKRVAAALHIDPALLEPIPKICPAEKILNPITNRCVKRDGAAGKKIAGKKTRKNRS